jgi:phosphate transport system substrate-binding protein
MSRKLGLIALLLVLALVAAACGDDAATTTTAAGSTTTGASLTGDIEISGSSTVEPISAGVAEMFNAMYPDVAIKVEGPGTGDGAQLFCTGQIDIGDASRAYKDSERELCAQNGVEFIELVVAIDGLSVLTSHDNETFACLATSDLYALMGPESLGFDNWSEANTLAAEIGAPNAPYPDADLAITAPGEESGTYDSFVEFAIKGLAEERGQDDVLRPDYVASPNDNVIIEGIAGSPTSLGFVGYAFYVANEDRVKALAIDGGDGCVLPTHDTIADGTYPYSRLLYIYVNQASAQRPEVAAYVDLYLSEQGLQVIDGTGYVRLADYAPTLEAWQNR